MYRLRGKGICFFASFGGLASKRRRALVVIAVRHRVGG